MMRCILTVAATALIACAPQAPRVDKSYGPPSASGLIAVRPYPTEIDVCQVIGENGLTADYLDHTATLIGCPAHEAGAIALRMSEGAVRVDHIGGWVLLSLPN